MLGIDYDKEGETTDLLDDDWFAPLLREAEKGRLVGATPAQPVTKGRAGTCTHSARHAPASGGWTSSV